MTVKQSALPFAKNDIIKRILKKAKKIILLNFDQINNLTEPKRILPNSEEIFQRQTFEQQYIILVSLNVESYILY